MKESFKKAMLPIDLQKMFLGENSYMIKPANPPIIRNKKPANPPIIR